MVIEEKLKQLKQLKTPHSTQELDRLAWARYGEIRDALEADRRGDFVMIEVDSGDYFVGKTADDALRNAKSAHSGKAFYLIRIGHRAAHKLKQEKLT